MSDNSISPTPRDSGVLNAFDALWNEADQPPDVFTFLKQHPQVTAEERAEIVLCDQLWHQRHGLELPVEEYLERLPEIRSDQPLKLHLVVREFNFRVAQGKRPRREEYVARFPDCGASLVAMLAPSPADDSPADGRLPTGRAREALRMPQDVMEQETQTESSERQAAARQADDGTEVPNWIGRYRVEKILGRGAFGRVYLAYDDELQRRVAIKVPYRDLISTPEEVKAYLDEARILAKLDHPGIVPVFDVGRMTGGSCYIVSKYIEESSLRDRLRQTRFSYLASARVVASVAEALSHAHRRGLVHRDIKPANIVLDAEDQPIVIDFGLALKEEEYGKDGPFAGTPGYMSPEQARGEGHLVDGRSDIFSLGVVLFELLTGTRPLKAGTREELIDRLKTIEVRPPRQWDPSIPRELERICLKSLAKRAKDRYCTALDMAEDLRHFVSQAEDRGVPPTETDRITETASEFPAFEVQVVPKGLRSFDAADAGSFLSLLPGARDRDGLPESIHFWKTRIEQTDSDQTFRVGLIYGPSGCGKSSLVKAGLLPCLADHVVPIYVEATANGTEARILRRLCRRIDNLSVDRGLIETLAEIRRGCVRPQGSKVVIVVDQFEQWLHHHEETDETELVRSLRQCDGGHVQAVLMVRDDFWLAVSRMMDGVEVELIQGHNMVMVDLFDKLHARDVLRAFGRAFGRLPCNRQEQTNEQDQFLDRVVEGLAEDGRVVPIRLAVLAEMVKGKPWTLKTIRALGGIKGIGITFLEESFSSPNAPPEHRLYQRPVRAVLKSLLPEQGTDIKGHSRTHQQLLQASGLGSKPKDFARLLRILDPELRLVTPTNPEGSAIENKDLMESSGRGERHYQLTHDYLVPAVREWLNRKQRETRRGRAEIRLAERTALWNARPEKRQLPSWWECLSIWLLTNRRKRTESERHMMSAATRHHLMWALAWVILATLVGWGWFEIDRRYRATMLKDRLLEAKTTEVNEIVRSIQSYRRWTTPRLVEAMEQHRSDPRRLLHLRLALLPVDPSQIQVLRETLLEADAVDVMVICEALHPYRERTTDYFWDILNNVQVNDARRLRAACALALLDSNSNRWSAVAPDVAGILVTEKPYRADPWIEAFRPVANDLLAPLQAVFRRSVSPEEQRVAAMALAEYLSADVASLLDLVLSAEVHQLDPLLVKLQQNAPEAVQMLERQVDQQVAVSASRDERTVIARQRANAAVALLAIRQGKTVWPLLRATPSQDLRTHLIHRLGPTRVDLKLLASRLNRETDVSVRRALIVGIGPYNSWMLDRNARTALVQQLLDTYRFDPDPGIHSAIDWLLKKWNQAAEIRAADQSLVSEEPLDQRNWYVNSEGHTMAVFNNPEDVLVGEKEAARYIAIRRTFAVATKEVTVEQFQRYRPKHVYSHKHSPTPDCPVNSVSWFEAAKYCRWLSEQEGIPEDQMCYPPVDEIREGFKPDSGHLNRKGYRLPTEAEWEYACRAGTETERYFGDDQQFTEMYAWTQLSASGRTWPVGTLMPNDFGLFDTLGNLHEWTYGSYLDASGSPLSIVVDEPEMIAVTNDRIAVLRGAAFNSHLSYIRVAHRNIVHPTVADEGPGFRIARTLN